MTSFDDHADSYRTEVDTSVSFTGKDVDFYAARKADELVHLVDRHLGAAATRSALDVGCGVGVTDGHLVGRFAELHGVDVAAEAVTEAAAANPTVRYQAYDGHRLPFDDGSFDVAFAVCVLHHVDVGDRAGFADELARVVRPGGLVAVFEHNPFNPLTRVAVSRCEFDEGVELLSLREVRSLLGGAGLSVVDRRYLLFLPVGGTWAQRVDRILRKVPAGAQHTTIGRR